MPMKQMRFIAGIIAILTLPLSVAGQALAATQSITQELHITAIVPAHRDIVIDSSGHITEIISNTPQDMTPTVYEGNDGASANIRPLTETLYANYRQVVPVGTSKTGILYRFSPVTVAVKVDAFHPRADSPLVHPAVAAAIALPWQTMSPPTPGLFD